MKPNSVTHIIHDELDVLLTERHAADILGVSIRALQKWRLKGSGPKFVRISGRCIRYRKRELIKWTEERIKTSTSDE